MNKKIKRMIIALVCVLLPIGILGFGYFTGGDKVEGEKLANTLTVEGSIEVATKNSVEIETNGIVPGDTIDKTISIKPNSTADSLMRVKIEPAWEDVGSAKTSNIKIVYAEGEVKDKIDSAQKDYWYKDGEYLYYMNAIKTEKEGIQLVKGIKFLGGDNDEDANKYQGKTLKINVTLEMIQCKYAPFTKKWTQISKDGELYNELIKLCPEANISVEE
ncbi:hypothetical protein [Terrisporobacter sp.]